MTNEYPKNNTQGTADDARFPVDEDASYNEDSGRTTLQSAVEQPAEQPNEQPAELTSLRLEVSALRKAQRRGQVGTLVAIAATAGACLGGGVIALNKTVESNRSAMRKEMYNNLAPLVTAKDISPQQANMIMRDARVGYFRSLSSAKIHDAVITAKSEADAYIEANRQFRMYTKVLSLDVAPDAFDRFHVNALNHYLELRLFMERIGIADKTDIARLGFSKVEAINAAYRKLAGSIGDYVQRNPQAFPSIGGSRLELIARDTAKQLGIKEVKCSGADCEAVIKRYIAEYVKLHTASVGIMRDQRYTSLLQRAEAAEAKAAECEVKK